MLEHMLANNKLVNNTLILKIQLIRCTQITDQIDPIDRAMCYTQYTLKQHENNVHVSYAT